MCKRGGEVVDVLIELITWRKGELIRGVKYNLKKEL
jgi:hypothetical protein